jgi:riboflavin kinase/FMN adenylyltransferase
VEVITDLSACPRPAARCVVTIGAYDGVHLGHRVVVERVRRIADDLNCSTAVVTFDRHPATVVRPESAPLLLTDLEQKLELLASTGVDYTLVLRFDEARSQESAEDFVNEVLVGCFAARAIVVGHDFHFGHQRRGNVALLRRMGADRDFEVVDLGLVTDAEGAPPISSTRIRKLLAKGDVAEAARLLGRPHEVRGAVQRGDGRGKELGFPTANISVPASILLPADGIYAGWYERPDGSVHGAAISVGRRPTFYQDGASTVEAFLLEFDGELYGERAEVRFVAPVREGQVAFESVDDLIAQMGRDVVATRAVLAL